jgi:hypothetical protein
VFADTVTEFHVVLAIHVVAIIVTFGAIFARPLVFSYARSYEPRSLPVLHRIEYTLARRFVWLGMLIVIVSGIYMTGYDERWSAFYVLWGISVIVLLALALITVLIPGARRAGMLAERDTQRLPASSEAIASELLSQEYRALDRRIATVGAALGVLILLTLLFMGTEFPY